MPDNATMLAMHRQMIRIRLFEEALARVYLEGKRPAFDIAAGPVPGEMHLAAGQEPVAAGVCAHLRPTDAVTATHRPHQVALAHGIEMRRLAAEIFGKETGLCHGKGATCTSSPASLRRLQRNHRRRHADGCRPRACVQEARPRRHRGLVLRRGAANQGAFHESIDLAALWGLGVVFVCEDNAWAISVPKAKSTSIADNAARAASYGIPGIEIHENDPVAVYEAAGEAVARARAENGPTRIEVRTDRLLGHFEGDPEVYRSKEEIDSLREHDAVRRFERALIEKRICSEVEAERVWTEAQAEVDEAIEFARTSPYPEPESALEHVFA